MEEANEKLIADLKGSVIVSVQAQDSEPLNRPDHLLALSKSALNGGAKGVRLCGAENINHIKKEIDSPIIGLTKVEPTPINWLDTVYITATMKDLQELLDTGVDIISLDGTPRERLDGSSFREQIEAVKKAGRIVLADISTLEEALVAQDLGVDIVSTTLSGYTRQTRKKVNEGPDLDLLADLTDELEIPAILEGRVWETEDVTEAFEYGAHSVVIGTAITRPHMITKRFVTAIPHEEDI